MEGDLIKIVDNLSHVLGNYIDEIQAQLDNGDYIELPYWYQVDFCFERWDNDHMVTLEKIAKLMDVLTEEDLITKWFYIWENGTIRVRMETDCVDKVETALPVTAKTLDLTIHEDHQFEPYSEVAVFMPSVYVVEAFANIMSELTKLSMRKYRDEIDYDSYRVMERIGHCMYTTLTGSCGKAEYQYLIMRLVEKTGLQAGFEDMKFADLKEDSNE